MSGAAATSPMQFCRRQGGQRPPYRREAGDGLSGPGKGPRGFTLLQFNAVVKSNASAGYLYEKLGFVTIGTVPGGFRMKGGSFEDIILYYHTL